MATIIGLTGGIASGKSTVSKMFKDLGIPVIDADIVARDVVEVGEDAYYKIIEEFGIEITHEDGAINREKLGSIIFTDEQKRKKLNSIVHPAVRQRMNDLKLSYIKNGEKTLVLDIPLLFESKLTYLVEKIILVYVNPEIQLERLMNRNGLTLEAANARISSQLPLQEKVALADAVLDNNGTTDETFEQLRKILKEWALL